MLVYIYNSYKINRLVIIFINTGITVPAGSNVNTCIYLVYTYMHGVRLHVGIIVIRASSSELATRYFVEQSPNSIDKVV